MKKLVHEEKKAITEIEQQINNGIKPLADYLKTFNSLPPEGDTIKTGQDLLQAILNPRAFYENAIKAKMPDMEYGLPVDKDARLRTIKLPDLSEVSKMAEEIKSFHGLLLGNGLVEINKDKLTINQEAKESRFSSYRIYASNDTEVKFMELQQNFYNAFAAFRDFNIEKLNETYGFKITGVDGFKIERYLTDTGINTELFKQTFVK